MDQHRPNISGWVVADGRIEQATGGGQVIVIRGELGEIAVTLGGILGPVPLMNPNALHASKCNRCPHDTLGSLRVREPRIRLA